MCAEAWRDRFRSMEIAQ